MINFSKLKSTTTTLTFIFLFLLILPIASAETITYPTYTADEYYSSAYSLYQSNPAAFDKTFKNKTIIINGEIEKIEKLFPLNDYVVYLVGGVHCFFDGSQASTIAVLSPGQQISIRGKASAGTIINSFNASLHQCKILNADSVPPTPEYTITAQELHKAFKSNELQATDKYKDKMVMVTGTVHSTWKDLSNKPIIAFRTYLPMTDGTVLCIFSEDEIASISKIRPGQKISIIGTVEQGNFYLVSLNNCTLK